MARWRLNQPHYLNVPGTEWEYQETSRETGRAVRKRYPVGLFLNPNDPADHNYPGEVIVCHEGKGMRKDIVFIGPPTGDMEPIDNEAEIISQAESRNWQHPIESLPGDYSASLLSDLERQLDAAFTKHGGIPKAVPTQAITFEQFNTLKQQVDELMAANMALMEKLNGPQQIDLPLEEAAVEVPVKKKVAVEGLSRI